MPEKIRNKWQRPFNWPPSTWEFTPGMQTASEVLLCLIFILIVATLLGALFLWPLLIWKTLHYVTVGSPDDVRNTLLAVAALIGAPFLIWRTLIAARQADISRESHYTALFTKAVEQLGSEKVVKRREFKPRYLMQSDGEVQRDPDGAPVQAQTLSGDPAGEYSTYEITVPNYEVRLGAIYALERIAQDSERDAWPIYLTLCSYIQNNCDPMVVNLANSDLRPRNNSDVDEIFHVLERYSGTVDRDGRTHFNRIHLPDLTFSTGQFGLTVFNQCSVNSVYAQSGLESVSFADCNMKTLDLRQGEYPAFIIENCTAKSVTLVDCACQGFKFSGACQDFRLIDCDLLNSRISLDSSEYQIANSAFSNCSFVGATMLHMVGRRRAITKSKFNGCIFRECDFSFMPLSDCVFEGCRFERCNIVGVAGIDEVKIKMVDCFRDADFVRDPSQQFVDLDLQAQWSRWRISHRPRDYPLLLPH